MTLTPGGMSHPIGWSNVGNYIAFDENHLVRYIRSRLRVEQTNAPHELQCRSAGKQPNPMRESKTVESWESRAMGFHGITIIIVQKSQRRSQHRFR